MHLESRKKNSVGKLNDSSTYAHLYKNKTWQCLRTLNSWRKISPPLIFIKHFTWAHWTRGHTACNRNQCNDNDCQIYLSLYLHFFFLYLYVIIFLQWIFWLLITWDNAILSWPYLACILWDRLVKLSCTMHIALLKYCFSRAVTIFANTAYVVGLEGVRHSPRRYSTRKYSWWRKCFDVGCCLPTYVLITSCCPPPWCYEYAVCSRKTIAVKSTWNTQFPLSNNTPGWKKSPTLELATTLQLTFNRRTIGYGVLETEETNV